MSCAVLPDDEDGVSNLTQQIPNCIPDLVSILLSISRIRPCARRYLLIWSVVVRGLRPVIKTAQGGGRGLLPTEFESHYGTCQQHAQETAALECYSLHRQPHRIQTSAWQGLCREYERREAW